MYAEVHTYTQTDINRSSILTDHLQPLWASVYCIGRAWRTFLFDSFSGLNSYVSFGYSIFIIFFCVIFFLSLSFVHSVPGFYAFSLSVTCFPSFFCFFLVAVAVVIVVRIWFGVCIMFTLQWLLVSLCDS